MIFIAFASLWRFGDTLVCTYGFLGLEKHTHYSYYCSKLDFAFIVYSIIHTTHTIFASSNSLL